MDERVFARALGWSCLGFAALSAVAPDAVARAMGLEGRRGLVRALGARDLVLGAGLAAARDPRPWLRTRLAADVADAVLFATGAATGALRPGRAAAVAVGATLLAGAERAVLRR